jgi:intraflagellar transport protein 80
MTKVCDLETFITDLHWFPSHSKRLASSTTDVFVMSTADGMLLNVLLFVINIIIAGSFLLVSKSGRIDKVIKDAHKGAVVTVKWDYEGNSIATGGEDGVLKIWSRAGQLRSTLANTGKCIYSLAWGPTSEQVLFTSGKDLIIKPIHAASKQWQWKAHDGTILKVDWNPLTKLIISGGEDGKYKVWDSYGRNLFTSSAYDYSITSVAWSPSGEVFAVGSFNMLKVCDKTGWAYNRTPTHTGAILNISWTSDGTQLGAAGGNGSVCFGQLVERRLEWKNLAVSLTEDGKMKIHDILKDEVEELDFRDKVINWSLGFGNLVVATATQCWIYDVLSWNTPHVFDVKDTINLILQCKKYVPSFFDLFEANMNNSEISWLWITSMVYKYIHMREDYYVIQSLED